MGDARAATRGQATDMGAMGAATAGRTFWWDRACPIDGEVHPLRAVVFDADSALGEVGGDGDLAPRAGLIDLVMSLFVEGIWVAVISRHDRDYAQELVRQLIGDGLVETIVSADDLDQPGGVSELYRLAMWELGVRPENALAVGGSASSLRAARAAGLPGVLVAEGYAGGAELTDTADCRRQHQRCGMRQHQSRAA
jgi:beta-phosphoglucomutase-like phosphatase (HAD superfamily)